MEAPETGSPHTERHGKIVALLAKRIVQGTYSPNDLLPSVEDLVTELDSSRTVVREGLKVLSAKGFVEARRRSGTRVLGRSSWSLMDRDVLGWIFQNSDDIEFGMCLLELRRIIEPEAAALAAKKASAADLAAMEKAYLTMSRSLPDDVEACCAADVAFHTALLRASGNILLEQLAHTISYALLTLFRMTTRLADSHAEALESHGALVEAIRARDVDEARRLAHEILGIAASRFDNPPAALVGLDSH